MVGEKISLGNFFKISSKRKKSVSDFEVNFSVSEKSREGLQGRSPAEMHFWRTKFAKSAIEYSTYDCTLNFSGSKNIQNRSFGENFRKLFKEDFAVSGKNSKAISISFRVDEGVVGHNNRDFIAKNVDKERIGNNITYRQQDIREKYNEIFSKALDEYNFKAEKLFYEIIM